MTRIFLAAITVVSALTLAPYAGKAQTPKKGAPPKFNQVYVKIILPGDPAARDKDRPVVESWIAEQLQKRGQSKFTAATAWVPLDFSPVLGGLDDHATLVWEGGCRVQADIPERADGRIKVLLNGWDPGSSSVTISLKDEPGTREIAAVEETKREEGVPYVAVLIGPPPENPSAPTGKSK